MTTRILTWLAVAEAWTVRGVRRVFRLAARPLTRAVVRQMTRMEEGR